MARKDELDLLLRDERINEAEWQALGKALGIYKILQKNKDQKRSSVNEEFRHCFGHTVANFLRNKYEPDYRIILKETFEKIGMKAFQDNEKIFYIEEKFYNFIIKDVEIEVADENNFFDKVIESGKNSWNFGKKFKNLSLKDGAVAVVGGLPLAVINKTFFDTNWKKVIPTILIISLIRKRLKILDEFEEFRNGKFTD